MANNNLIVIAYLSQIMMFDRDVPSAMVVAPVLGKENAG
jgi:hypothetical protein